MLIKIFKHPCAKLLAKLQSQNWPLWLKRMRKRSSERRRLRDGTLVCSEAYSGNIDRDLIVTCVRQEFIMEPLMAELFRREIRDEMAKDAEVNYRYRREKLLVLQSIQGNTW